MHEFQVNKQDFTKTRLVENNKLSAETALSDDEIIVRVDSFALTANNITYAVLGDKLGYWQFFPASDNTDNSWGIIPVWGFATVISSHSNDIAVGEKLFGYFPPTSLVKMTATQVSSQRFFDGSAHRAALPPGYNIYRRVLAEPGYNESYDNQRMLLFPLHITSFCLCDYLESKQWFDAEQVIIISASSKTSIGLAYGIDDSASAPNLIGMTSTRNHEFVNKLGVYQQVINYGDLSQLNSKLKTVIVDMAGNAEQLKAIEQHMAGNLTYCLQVGLTHWDETSVTSPLTDTDSEMFFAPGHIQKRITQWGAKEFDRQSMTFMAKSSQRSAPWLTFTTIEGIEQMTEVYADVCNGVLAPEKGIIIKP